MWKIFHHEHNIRWYRSLPFVALSRKRDFGSFLKKKKTNQIKNRPLVFQTANTYFPALLDVNFQNFIFIPYKSIRLKSFSCYFDFFRASLVDVFKCHLKEFWKIKNTNCKHLMIVTDTQIIASRSCQLVYH